MDKKTEALKLALDAIDEFCELNAIIRPIEVRDAIREALAEQPAKPWVDLTENTILNLMPESIPAEHDSALLSFAHEVIEAYKEKNT